MAVSSGGIALMFFFPVAGFLAPKFDPRWLVAIGFMITTFGLYRMTSINLNIPFSMAVSWRVVIALGLPFLFIPINTLCYTGIPQEKYNEVSGFSALMRNLGGSVGISFVTTLLARLTQKHLAMLAPTPSAATRPLTSYREGLRARGCNAELRCPTRCNELERRFTAWHECRPGCFPMSMSFGSWSRRRRS